jgi:PiT family inorganic phosphate transporter
MPARLCLETAGSITLFLTTGVGIPVSTTHMPRRAIVAVGAANWTYAARWDVAKDIVSSWLITLPATGAIGAVFSHLHGLVG